MAPAPQKASKNKGAAFTVIASVLGVLALGAGTWFGVTEYLNKSNGTDHSNAQSSPSVAGQKAQASSGGGASPTSSSSPDPEQQAADQLRAQAATDLTSVDLDAGDYVPRLATKWVGQTTSENPTPQTSVSIKAEFDADQKRFGNIKVLQSNKVGRQSPKVTPHPDAYIAYVDTHFSTSAEAQDWCNANVSTDMNDCAPQALNHPHS